MKFKSLPSREDILQYYVTENHTKNEALSHFCIGHRKFDELLLVSQYIPLSGGFLFILNLEAKGGYYIHGYKPKNQNHR